MDDSSKKKVLLAGVMLVVAVGIGYYQIAASSISQAEIRDSVRGETYIACCKSCGEKFDIDAVEYMDAVHEAGKGNSITCRLCGAADAWKCGDKALDPTPEGLDEFDLSSLAGIEDAKRSLNADYADIQDELHRAERSGDQARADELDKKIKELNRRRAYLDEQWDEMAMEQAGR